MNSGLKSGFGASMANRSATIQTTSKTTAVRVDKMAGLILTNNEAMSTGTFKDFIVNNAFFKVGDVVAVQMLISDAYPGINVYTVAVAPNVKVKDGQFTIRISNNSGSSWGLVAPISFAITSLGGA
jgi:hypothetical protein